MWDNNNQNGSVIGEDLVIEGDINSKSDVMILGCVEGNISCVSLFVTKNGKVVGGISSKTALVEGTIEGKVTSDSLELRHGANVSGEIASRTLSIDHGAVFNGSAKPVKGASEPVLKSAAE